MSNEKKSNIEKEFVPYAEALELKQLGFDEPCFGVYATKDGYVRKSAFDENGDAPTYSQAFRWFRYKYWYTALILCDSYQIVMQLSTSKTLDSKTGEYKNNYSTQTYHKEVGLKSYDESELACLKKLIEIANEQH